MTFPKIGQLVIWLRTSAKDGTTQEIVKGVVTKLGKDVMWVDNQHKSEDCLYSAFAYPAHPDCSLLLNTILLTKARHKQEDLDLLTEQLEMKNRIARGEIE